MSIIFYLSKVQKGDDIEKLEQRIKDLEGRNRELERLLEENKSNRGKDELWSQNIINSIPNPVFIKDEKFQFVLTNSAFREFVNLSNEELLGKTDRDFFSEEQSKVFLRIDAEVITNGVTNWNEEELTIDGKVHNLITSKVRIVDSAGNRYVLGIITDITDKENQQILLSKQKDELQLEKSNVQTLLKEVHHRVKNNLQIISSLLNFQMRKFEEDQVRQAFINCKSRVIAMAKVHERLYQTENFSHINFATYIQSLVENLKLSFNLEDRFEFDLQLINVFLNVDTAIPLGMVVNEIVTNSIKHVQSEGETLKIYLVMNEISDRYQLLIGDSGESTVVAEKADEGENLGMELVELFCKQVEADISRVEAEGAGYHYDLRFSNREI